MIYYYQYSTPIGVFNIGAIDKDIVFCQFEDYDGEGIYQETETLKEANRQLQEYFIGKRKHFDLTYRYMIGTPFQHRVWNALLEIPYGEVSTYQEIAEKIGSSKAYRAVGNANHKNPLLIMIPCHRVITTNHQLGGYRGGARIKQYLLELEESEFIKS